MSITPTLHRTFHIINCSVYFLLPAHAAALFFYSSPFRISLPQCQVMNLKKTSNIKRKISFYSTCLFLLYYRYKSYLLECLQTVLQNLQYLNHDSTPYIHLP